MTIGEIETLFAYNEWANGRLLEAAASLEPEEQTRDLGSSHRSVRGTLYHIVFGEWDWLHFWKGKSWKDIAQEEPPETDFPNIASLQVRWTSIAQEEHAFVRTLTEDRFDTPVSFANFEGQLRRFSLAQMIHHVLSHSSYHRGQVVTLLRQLDKIPPPTDFLIFEHERMTVAGANGRVI